ncbi:GNAT family N-acetyltransferase [Mesorhizobium escarrei]|uniref:Histone acetyltransferase HPA2 and related acetyltransferases n=1 Tax=Mesorhizobium escarrei TaxID=666018 RepID=A0ABN8K6Q2_9HYPH|nr:GNAT family N-acetyltransferase [Mesorhizobium escarrei]CAH2405260.1 Histone acetyltransferase HPA2 and related acetyltransferases [Mesorhizobium escarrei]
MTIEHDRDIVSAPTELMKFETRHVPGALKLSQEMVWPYRRDDWEFAATVGNGLVLERAGEVIGTAMWWNYGQAYATAGMIIVTGSAQGGGHGSRLLNELLEATDGRNVLLNSTEEGLTLYKRRGFTAWGTVIQHQGPLTVAVTPNARDDIRSASVSDLAAIQVFDKSATGMCRPSMVAALADVGNVLVIERAGRVAGYAIARRFGRGYVVGPVAAESAQDARLLILAQLSKLHRQFVRIDAYAEHGLGGWLESLGLKQVGFATAMVKGRRPVSDGPAGMYALANQSFG